MRSYSETHVFSEYDLWMLKTAQDLVARIPEDGSPNHPEGLLRCHEIARVVAKCLHIEQMVEDGKYGHTDHSWIRFPNTNILDVYAVGRLPMVQLVCCTSLTLLEPTLYKRLGARTDIDHTLVEQLHAVLCPVGEIEF